METQDAKQDNFSEFLGIISYPKDRDVHAW